MKDDIYSKTVLEEISHYDGNMAKFARHMASIMPDLDAEAHRWRLRMLKQHEPDMFPTIEVIDYNAEIPLEFDGSMSQLAMIMSKRFPEISKNGWESRVRRAYEREAVKRTETPHFIVEHLKKAQAVVKVYGMQLKNAQRRQLRQMKMLVGLSFTCKILLATLEFLFKATNISEIHFATMKDCVKTQKQLKIIPIVM